MAQFADACSSFAEEGEELLVRRLHPLADGRSSHAYGAARRTVSVKLIHVKIGLASHARAATMLFTPREAEWHTSNALFA